ncbi:MAG: exosortase/archaeosortase family protein [Verrucomicrobiota bacterium]
MHSTLTAMTDNAPFSAATAGGGARPDGRTAPEADAGSTPRHTGKRNFLLAGLLAFAAFIWLRDMSWVTAAEDTVPVLIALPLCLWMGKPWEWRREAGTVSPLLPAAAVLLGLAGILTDATLLLAGSWCLLALAFCRAHLVRFAPRLLLLALLGFPWIHQSAGQIGWWFRYTGAGVSAGLFTAFGQSVTREGTFLMVNHMPLSVEAACGGLNVLQAMLVAGVVVALRTLPAGKPFWIASLLLLPFAWLANTLRIFLIGVTGLVFGAEFAMGWFHTFGGWIVLCLMFLLCQALLEAARRFLLKTPRPA